MAPRASIVIPTRGRPQYLKVALASIAPQSAAAQAELIVIDDGSGQSSSDTRALAQRFGAGYVAHPRPLGLNAARNTGVQRSSGELVIFADDDIRAAPGWLDALLQGARRYPDVDVFTGPIRPALEGPAPRSCDREHAPVTSLELGSSDTDARFAWGANMAIRRSALERTGPFDPALQQGGDEQEWQERHMRAGGAPPRYLAAAAVEHRRAAADARLRALARGAHARGRGARRFDAHRGAAPAPARELLTLVRSLGHVVRRRCPAGLLAVAHSAGRLREALREALRLTRSRPPHVRAFAASGAAQTDLADAAGEQEQHDFLSGTSGTVGGVDAVRRSISDAAHDAAELASGRRLRLLAAARRSPQTRRVLVLMVQRPQHRVLAHRARAELARTRHSLQLYTCAPGGAGKFENLNRLLAAHPPEGHDWLLVVDDDVELPRGFLDRFLFVCERFGLALAQPAHRSNSHAAWPQTRRRPRSVARETSFVEIGPVTAFAPVTFATLLPFPPLRMGWGLDLHWAHLARAHGWRCGVVDAVAIRHRAAPAAEAYPREHAIEEARRFLAQRPYVSASEATRTLATHRRL